MPKLKPDKIHPPICFVTTLLCFQFGRKYCT